MSKAELDSLPILFIDNLVLEGETRWRWLQEKITRQVERFNTPGSTRRSIIVKSFLHRTKLKVYTVLVLVNLVLKLVCLS